MNSQTKRNLLIAASVGLAIIGGIFIKNKIEQGKFKPISKEILVQILKKARKQNFALYKQIATASTNIAAQMGQRQIDPQMAKAYLESPQSPLKIQETIQKNYVNVCNGFSVTYADFKKSVQDLIQKNDQQIKSLVEDSTKDYEESYRGKQPQIKVTVPEGLTKQKLLAVHKKLTIKRYLIQIEIFRRLRGKTEKQMMSNPQLLKNLPNPQEQQQKILREEAICPQDQPPSLVFIAAIQKYKNDRQFKEKINKEENHYAQIFNKYKMKMAQHKITQDELNQMEDQIIFTEMH